MYTIIAKYISALFPDASRVWKQADRIARTITDALPGRTCVSPRTVRGLDLSHASVAYNETYPGLDAEQAAKLLHEFGPNEIPSNDQPKPFMRVVNAVLNPFTLILLTLAAVSFVTDFWFAPPEKRDLTAVGIILIMLAVSAILRLVQEGRSTRAVDELRTMVRTHATVTRDGKKQTLPIEELVPGDLTHLSAGDIIAADMLLLTAKDFFVSQSGFTGESEPVEKFAFHKKGVHENFKGQAEHSDNDESCRVFTGSTVISGSARAVVTATGEATAFGCIARSLSQKRPGTSFDQGISRVSGVFVRFMLVMAPIVLFINGMTKGDWPEAILFALSVAVGITPEILPVIVTINLGKGALTMARKKVVVKRLNAMQNFGAMDVLCTDKTGTLTMDDVALELHLNIHGKNDTRVLRHAFLNSRFQTGLRNLLDAAILRHAGDCGMAELAARYHMVDEIPFDFNRRRMSVVLEDKGGKLQMITKGAVEEMLEACAYAEYKGQIMPLTAALRTKILKTANELNAQGLRVLGIAQKTFAPQGSPANTAPSETRAFSICDESDMVLMGYLAFLDPPKESAASAIRAFQEYGIAVKVLTGDNEAVTRCVCERLGIDVTRVVAGPELDLLTDEQAGKLAERAHVFAKLSPAHKARIVRILRDQGRTVGFLGDGINDAQAMHCADVSISVDSAVGIARETADIILLEKDLMVLEHGVVEGRKVFGNIIKYIKITASSNFGNIFSVVAASAFLPFLPMLPLQLLLLNLIYEIACVAMPWDNVDADYLKQPRAWNASSIGRFMRWIGPTSSLFDILTFAALFFIICPAVCGADYHNLDPAGQVSFAALFQAGWFVESLWTQMLVIHLLRTPRIPFLQSRMALPVMIGSFVALAAGTLLPYLPAGNSMGFVPLPANFFPWLAAMLLGYALVCQTLKSLYQRRFCEFL